MKQVPDSCLQASFPPFSAQLLVESPSRAALQKFLAAWQAVLQATRAEPQCKGLIRWAIDVDPLAI